MYMDSAKALRKQVARERFLITPTGWQETGTFEMVVSCCAYGCANRQGSQKGLGFFRSPCVDETTPEPPH